jgi:uncharacterized protein YegL
MPNTSLTSTTSAPLEKRTNNFKAGECVSKQVLNIFFVIDSSGSMEGAKIASVNTAIRDILTELPEIQKDTADATIKLSAIRFSDDSVWLYPEPREIKDFVWHDLDANGGTALEKAYETLNDRLVKESKGGIMPDYGGVAPIILLMTDGEPNTEEWRKALYKLQGRGWFTAALKYALAIGISDPQALKVLQEFTGSSETVLKTFDVEELKRIIKVIIVTASKVKSRSANSQVNPANGKTAPSQGSQNTQAIQNIGIKLQESSNDRW